MAKKVSRAYKPDSFFVIVVSCVVIIAAIVVSASFLGNERRPQVEGARTESAGDLMNQLQGTVDDGGAGDLMQLRKDASGI